MFHLAAILTGAALPLASAYGLGSLLTRRQELPAPLRLALGSCCLILYNFALLALGWAILPALLLPLASLAFAPRPRLTRPCWYWLALAPYALYYAVHALSPETQPDAVTYHLGIVADWVRHGAFSHRITFYEVLPLGLETLFAPAYAVGGATAAKLVHTALLAATLPLLASLARRLQSSPFAAVAIYAAAPVTGIAATAAYNDAALVFLVIATFWLLLDERWRLAAFAAGFCYAIKLPGLLYAAAVVLYLLWRRQWRAVPLVLAGIAPWMGRATFLTANPVAPLLNRFFENPYFHVSTEATVATAFSAGEGWAALFWDTALSGKSASGLGGPVILLAPLLLLAHRALLSATLVALLPWFLNPGARFLMPALAFFGIALPRRLAPAIAAAHLLLSFPPLLDLWETGGAWRLRGFPWQAALRIEDESTYLRRTLWNYPIAEMVARHTRPSDHILDLITAPQAYFPATASVYWQSAPADRAVHALADASRYDHTSFWEWRASFPPTPIAGLRLETTNATPQDWGIAELELHDGPRRIQPTLGWILDAHPNPWEAPLAIDRNRASRWQSWRPRQPGMFWEARFARPTPVSEVRMVANRMDANFPLRLSLLRDGVWNVAAPSISVVIPVATSLRQQATRFARREGFGYLLAATTGDGMGLLGMDFSQRPADWGLEPVGQALDTTLYRIR